MPDPLHVLLTTEADRRLAEAEVPRVSTVRVRITRTRTTRRPTLVVPLVVALSAAGVAFGASALAPNTRPPAFVLEERPELGPIVPPLPARTRLGAPLGHVNGPPVDSADLLAVSKPNADGVVLRSVAVVQEPNSIGRVDRCYATYSDPGADVLTSDCRQGGQAETVEEGITLRLGGGGDRTYVQGTAPEGTAAMLVRPDGGGEVQVPTAPPEEPVWGTRVHYVTWWSRTGADLVAVDAEGRELSAERLPDPDPREAGEGDPELGTLETPLQVRRQLEQQHTMAERAQAEGFPREPRFEQVPAHADILARARVGRVTLYTLGVQDGEYRCTMSFTYDPADIGGFFGGGSGCGTGLQPPDLSLGRSYAAGDDPQDQLVHGIAPAGTERVRLSAPDLPSREIDVFDAGPRWGNLGYFLAPWPSSAETVAVALDADGRELARSDSEGLDLDAGNPRYLEAIATCLEARGVEVTRYPEGAYSYAPGKGTLAQMQAAEKECKVLARRQVPAPKD